MIGERVRYRILSDPTSEGAGWSAFSDGRLRLWKADRHGVVTGDFEFSTTHPKRNLLSFKLFVCSFTIVGGDEDSPAAKSENASAEKIIENIKALK